MMVTKTFQNERGRTVIVEATSTDGGDIKIKINGPHSEATNLVTYREAKVLHSALGRVLAQGRPVMMTIDEVADEIAILIDRYEPPRFKPIGWSDRDCELVAESVEPIRRDLRRILASLQGSPWQPIETALKDGTEIILGVFNDNFVDPIIMNSCWIDGEERGCYWHDWHGMPAPTHWQHVNAPVQLDALPIPKRTEEGT